MMVALVAHAKNQTNSGIIYHVGSSLRNPINITMLRNFSFRHFVENPLYNKEDGKPIIVGKGNVLPNMTTFRLFMLIRFILPLMVCLAIETCMFIYVYIA